MELFCLEALLTPKRLFTDTFNDRNINHGPTNGRKDPDLMLVDVGVQTHQLAFNVLANLVCRSSGGDWNRFFA